MPREFTPPTDCPVCGEPVPPTARACPGCGADERSGWDEAATRYDDLDLPAEAFGEDASPGPRPVNRRVLLVITGLLLLAIITTFVFR